MNNSKDRRYRLLKDLPDAKAGTILTKSGYKGDLYMYEGLTDEGQEASWYVKDVVECMPEWFEELKEASIQEGDNKITGICFSHDNQFGSWHSFGTKKPVDTTEYLNIAKAIENCLNSKEEDKVYNQLGEEVENANPCHVDTGKTYTQQEVDTIRREAFVDGYFAGWYNGCFGEDKTISSKVTDKAYDEYIKTTKRTPQPTPTSFPIKEDKGSQIVCRVQVGMKILHKEDGNWDKIGRITTVMDIDFGKDNVYTSDQQNYSIKGFLDRIDSGRYEVVYYPQPIPEQPTQPSTKEQGLSMANLDNSIGCGICGGKLVTIRGKHPGDDKREVCAICTTERLEQINEISSREYGKTVQSN